MKRSAIAVLLVALAAAPALAAGLQVEVVDSRPYMVAYDVNNGSAVCGDNQIDGVTTAVVWHPGAGADILGGSTGMSQAGDINEFGDVVGWYESPSGVTTAVIWSANGSAQAPYEIGLPPAARADTFEYTQGYAINDAGEVGLVAGLKPYVQPDGTRLGQVEDPYYWSLKTGFVPLGHLSGQRTSGIRGINETGTLVGFSASQKGMHAVTWTKNGKIRDLGLPKGATESWGQGINGAGTVVGYTQNGRDAFRWTEQGGFLVLPDFGYNAEARGINNQGTVVGVADLFPFESTPVVWDARGKIYDLGALLGRDRYYLFDAVAINDGNEVVAYGLNMQTGDRDAVLLRLTFQP